MLKEFFQGIKSFDEETKWLRFRWMKFEFYFRQPLGMAFLLVLIIIRLIQNDSREGFIPIAAMGIVLLVWMLLIFFCMLRRKYSFHCLMIVFALQSIGIPITAGVSVWSIVIAAMLFLALFLYYSKREDFFIKEREEAGINKRNATIGGALGAALAVVIIAMLLCIKAWNYRNMPAKITECVDSVLDETWTLDQAKVVAGRWVSAVEMEDTEAIQEVLEEMLVEQEEKVKYFFLFEKSEFHAGIDPKKCDDVLSCIDADEHGTAYYSLARVNHYYDVQSKSHKPEVETKQSEDRLWVTVSHGRLETKIEFVDMNEIVGEEGKENLRKKGFSDEDIASVLGNIYTDEDISFVEELVKATDKEAYAQVFKRDPDKLSAAGQEALYQFAYVLLCNNIKYDERLYVTEDNLELLGTFCNGILKTLSNRKKEDYCERYLKVLSDKGEYRMSAVADQMCENYNRKDVVVGLLPEFCLNTELNVLFSIFEKRIDDNKIYKYNRIMQVGKLHFMVGYDNLLDNYVEYEEVIQGVWKYEQNKIGYVDKYTANDGRYWSYYDRSEITTEEWLYEDVIYGIKGVHDINNVLKAEWLKREGISFLAAPEVKDIFGEIFYPEDGKVQSFCWTLEGTVKERNMVPFLHLIWTGKPYEYEDGRRSKWDNICELPYDAVVGCMNVLDVIAMWTASENDGIRYFDVSTQTYREYNILEDYYFNDEE